MAVVGNVSGNDHNPGVHYCFNLLLSFGDTYQSSIFSRTIANRAIGGVYVLIILFCVYIVHTRAVVGNMRGCWRDRLHVTVLPTSTIAVTLKSSWKRKSYGRTATNISLPYCSVTWTIFQQ